MQRKEFLIVDEISMEDKATAYYLSRANREDKTRALEEKGRRHEPFGSMHVIKSGDFHTAGKGLYFCPKNLTKVC